MPPSEIQVVLPDGSKKALAAGATGADLAKAIGPGLAKAALAIRVDGEVRDLQRPLPDGVKVSILTDKDPNALDVLRHSSAHVLATAVRQLFPTAQIGFGPPIEDGFYYDFDIGRPFGPEDLEAIEKKMVEVVKEDYPFQREEVSRAEAKKRFKDDPLKLERIDDLGSDEVISVYTDGPFVDLCRGPHVPSTGKIKFFKLLHAAGAYWRGDEKRQMLQRIYGTAWFSKEALEQYITRLEEARKRDHRVIGKQQDLFSIQEDVGPGLIMWHPNGAILNFELRRFIEDIILARGAPAAVRRQSVPGDGGGGGRVGGRALSRQADELPHAHPDLREPAAQLSRPADPPRRDRERVSQRALGDAARHAAGARPVDGRRAHLPARGSDRGRDLQHARHRRARDGQDVRAPVPARPRDAARQEARHRRDVGGGGEGARERIEAAWAAIQDGCRRWRVLRPEDRHQVQRRDRPRVAGRHDPARLRAARALPARVHRRRQQTAPHDHDAPRDLRDARAVHGLFDRALCGSVPALALTGAGARAADRRWPDGRRARRA